MAPRAGGPNAERQVWDIVNKYPSSVGSAVGPQDVDGPKAIVVYLFYDGEQVVLTDAAMVYGGTPERYALRGHLRVESRGVGAGALGSFFLEDPRHPGIIIPEAASCCRRRVSGWWCRLWRA